MLIGKKSLPWIDMIKELDLSAISMKKFGRTMCICLFVFGFIAFIKHSPAFNIFWLIALFSLGVGYICPLALRIPYRAWMAIAFYLGWINTRIILIIVYYLAVTPIGVLTKIFGKDLLDVKLEKTKSSYWLKRKHDTIKKENYERIF